MLKNIIIFLVMVMLFSENVGAEDMIKLPKPEMDSGTSVEQAIFGRKSVRSFSDDPLNIDQVGQILWSAGGATVDGITGPTRAYPSAGAVYPLEIYLVAGNVKGLEPGIYKYNWRRHGLTLVKKGDMREALSKAALSQQMVSEAPVTIVVTAVYEKTARAYGQRGVMRYVSMDAGHMGQNVSLEAQALGLGTVMVGAFIDGEVVKLIGTKDEKPVYMMPVGVPVR